MIISMEEYRKAKALNVAAAVRYDDEVLCVNWNPAVGAIAKASFQTPAELSPPMPREHAPLDREFLDRVYALATQV